MLPFDTIILNLFFLILFIGIYLVFFDLLGTFIIFLDVLFYSLINDFSKIGCTVIISLLIIAVVTEILDFFFVMRGAHQPVITKKAFGITAVGAILGAVILTPLLGGLGMWGGFFLGCFASIMVLETIRQKNLKTSYRVSSQALIAMGLRKFFKGFIALVMIAVTLLNIYH